MLTKIRHYGFRRPEDFDKYEALRLSEQLAASARLASDPKAPSYEAIASTLRQKIGSPVDQFKAYFSALLADKEYSRILHAVHKVDKAFKTGTHSVQRETPSLPSAAPVLNFQSFVTPVAYQAISLRVASDDLAKIPIHAIDLIISGLMVTDLLVVFPMVTVLAMVGVARDHHRLMTLRHLRDCSFGRCVLSPSHSCSSTICEPYFGILGSSSV